MSVLVIGTVAYDGLETPFGVRERILGGSATYIGLSASYLTKPVHLVSVVGEDFEQAHIDMLNRHNVRTEGLEVMAGQKTFFWTPSSTYLSILTQKFRIPPKIATC